MSLDKSQGSHFVNGKKKKMPGLVKKVRPPLSKKNDLNEFTSVYSIVFFSQAVVSEVLLAQTDEERVGSVSARAHDATPAD